MLKKLLPVLLLSISTATQAAASQTYPSEHGPLTVTPLVHNLEQPWALAFLPDDQGLLITERPGRLRLLDTQGRLSAPLAGVPLVWAQGQGGLLDVALSPAFAKDRLVYLSFAEGGGPNGSAGSAVGRGQLSADRTRLDNFTVIFRQQPKLSVGNHFGVRLAFDRAGYLFIALGENNQRASAQDLDKLQGKVVRLFADGRIPPDNPFVGHAGARPEIWSYGHRNQQGAALNPWTGVLWTHEHGPRGGDEINIIQAGGNYGWPLATHGINYSGQPIPEARGTSLPGMLDPTKVWSVSPGISGMAFYTHEKNGPWAHNLFIGALKDQSLLRLQLEGNKVIHEERLLVPLKARIRDVREGPDGALYVLTDAQDGALLRIALNAK
jgi:glucose/arabinose dehydrogenase